jgi:hypothetical protein
MNKDNINEFASFDEYLRQGEPSQKESAENWKTAIGLQAVDGLQPSAYLIDVAKRNIEGEITLDETRKLIDSYYQSKTVRTPKDEDEEEADKVSGDGLKAYSVVCGSFGVKANAEGLKQYLDGQGYNAKVVYNAERNTYRVIASSYDDRAEATQAKEEFKAKYPNRDDFQKAWLLYRVY